ncbi:MAG: undecaprenyl/decaprenyl-phosphate alpha-N-acetylglucosaminyl 1-phosphate transferase [Planctomycetaceae bacterium]|nr:MAG: undecaprenyl/decaprenyl-phosphate alpha-N-acetylglucosaminyl 1-phosphate transferase [Planctomycetaceae bacterium]
MRLGSGGLGIQPLSGGVLSLSEPWVGIWLAAVTAVPACLVSGLVMFPIRRHARRLGLLDRPGGHKSHVVPTPLGGGIGIWLGVVTTIAAGTLAVAACRGSESLRDWLPTVIATHLDGVWSRVGEIWGLMAGGTILVGLGLWDDRRGIGWQLRLGVQFLVATGVVLGLGYGFTVFIPLPWLTQALSIIWVVALINSFNMLDNMDGLSGGVAIIGCASLAVVMFSTPGTAGEPQWFVAALLMVLLGAAVGFLFHNWPPAKIFMGDGGSYFVGYLIAVATLIATYANYESGTPHAVFAPVCALAVPLYDLTTVLWIRLREGRSPFQADQRHFSHRLVALGLSRTRAVLTIYLVCATCGLAAVLLTRVGVDSAAMVLGIVGCMLLLIGILESTGWRNGNA